MTSRRLPSLTAAAMFPSRLAPIFPALAGQRREPHPHLTLPVVVVLAKAPAIALPLRVLVGGTHPDSDQLALNVLLGPSEAAVLVRKPHDVLVLALDRAKSAVPDALALDVLLGVADAPPVALPLGVLVGGAEPPVALSLHVLLGVADAAPPPGLPLDVLAEGENPLPAGEVPLDLRGHRIQDLGHEHPLLLLCHLEIPFPPAGSPFGPTIYLSDDAGQGDAQLSRG
jgi:hypothetical protein